MNKHVLPTTITAEKIAIVGSGPAGMLAALELANKAIPSVLIGPKPNPNDRRTTTLMMPAIELLQHWGVWDTLEAKSSPLSVMRIIDGTSRLIRSPTVEFRASEIGSHAFGYNIPNKALNESLQAVISQNSNIRLIHANVDAVTHDATHVELKLSDGQTIEAQLVIAADGRQSILRDAAQIEVKRWDYPQTAVILSFNHELSHQNISTEFHTENGPFTQVPLPGLRSSLVWVTDKSFADHLAGLGLQKLAEEIESRMHSMLGKVSVEENLQLYPLGGALPKKFAAKRTILIGETAHVFPPIGAQGLNLSMRDVTTLGKILNTGMADYGCDETILAYNRRRKPDILFRTGAVDMLNRALLSHGLPAQLARFSGLEALRQFRPLRSFFMREGMYPGSSLKAIPKFFDSLKINFRRP